MDDIEARYRQIAEEFVIVSHRTTSPALSIVYLRLAGHYAMLAQFHARWIPTSRNSAGCRRARHSNSVGNSG
jgi:hypothetical protein